MKQKFKSKFEFIIEFYNFPIFMQRLENIKKTLFDIFQNILQI